MPFATMMASGHTGHHSQMPLFMVVPFVLMLLSIAVMPLVKESWWEHNRNKLKVALFSVFPQDSTFLLPGMLTVCWMS